MSRFSNLEFGGGAEGRPRAQEEARDAEHYVAEAQGAFEQADFEAALRAYAKALEFNPQNVVAWTGQVRALIELGEFAEASLWADKALEQFPGESELLAAKAVALARNGDVDGAAAFSDASISERGDTPYVWLARGDVLLARRERRAEFCFEKAMILAAKDWFITWLAARIRAFHKQFSLALRLAQQALELKPDHAVLWFLAGSCQRELGLVGPAQNSFRQAIELNPRHHEAKVALGELAQTGLGTRLGGWWKRHFRR
jgi:tetratricopeptide (TPR) repeat protein